MDKNKKTVTASKVEAPSIEKEKATALQVVSTGKETSTEYAEFKVIEEPKKVVLNLDQTLKIVEELHLKKRHRDRLEMSINELSSFEVIQKSEDLDGRSHYQGCTIKISDDNRQEWSTKNPAIITEVINFMKSKFLEKLTEIEAQIILPA